MGKIYKGQTDLTIEVTLNFNITGFSSSLLIFRSPKGEEKIATTTSVLDSVNGVLKFTPDDDTFFDETGIWRCWAKCISSRGLICIGESSQFIIYEEGY
jgi:hypothetical protein